MHFIKVELQGRLKYFSCLFPSGCKSLSVVVLSLCALFEQPLDPPHDVTDGSDVMVGVDVRGVAVGDLLDDLALSVGEHDPRHVLAIGGGGCRCE